MFAQFDRLVDRAKFTRSLAWCFIPNYFQTVLEHFADQLLLHTGDFFTCS